MTAVKHSPPPIDYNHLSCTKSRDVAAAPGGAAGERPLVLVLEGNTAVQEHTPVTHGQPTRHTWVLH